MNNNEYNNGLTISILLYDTGTKTISKISQNWDSL